MIRWFQKSVKGLPDGQIKILNVGFFLAGLLCLCLLIAGLVDDGANEFNNLFYRIETVKIEDPRVNSYLDYLRSQNFPPEITKKFLDIFSEKLETENRVLNSAGQIWFSVSMVILSILFFSFSTAVEFLGLREAKIALESAKEKNELPESYYRQIINVLDQLSFENKKQKLAKLNQQKLIREKENADTDYNNNGL